MNVSATEILSYFTGTVLPNAIDLLAGVTTGRFSDPKRLQEDEFPHASLFGFSSEVEVLDWKQRKTLFSFELALCWKGSSTAAVIAQIEQLEGQSVTAQWLGHKVDSWYVTSWDLYDLDPDDIILVLCHIETTRIEP